MTEQLPPPEPVRRQTGHRVAFACIVCVFAVAILLLGRCAAVLLRRLLTDAYLTPDLRLLMVDQGTFVIVDKHGGTSMILNAGNSGIRTLGRAHGHFFGTIEGAGFSPDQAWFTVGEDTGTVHSHLTEANMRRYLPGATAKESLRTFDAFQVWCDPSLVGGLRK